jgi:hypothetical protein
MTATYGTLDARLRDLREVRTRCAASLRAILRDAERLTGSGASQDRQQALEVERQAAMAALEALLTPPVIPAPAMDALDKEAWHAAEASLREGAELPRRERNRSHRLPAEQGMPDPEPPAPEPEPEPAAAPEPAEPLWRLNLARRRAAAAAVPA